MKDLLISHHTAYHEARSGRTTRVGNYHSHEVRETASPPPFDAQAGGARRKRCSFLAGTQPLFSHPCFYLEVEGTLRLRMTILKQKARRGFTLIELLVVIAYYCLFLIGLLLPPCKRSASRLAA